MGKVFSSKGGNWRMNAFVRTQRSNRWTLQAAGYQRAAELILEQIKVNRHEIDTLVFPLVFNYRHCIELRLKEIIEQGSQLIDEDYKIPVNHNLESLWRIAKPILQKIYPELTQDADVAATEDVFREFSSYDAGSTAFRYPVDTNGNDSLSIRIMNIASFVNQVAPVIRFLEAMTEGIAGFEDLKG